MSDHDEFYEIESLLPSSPTQDISTAWGAFDPEDQPDLSVKGNKSILFSNKAQQGSKPGFVSGFSRQETLLLNLHGKAYGNQLNVNISDDSISAPEEKKTTLEVRNKLFSIFFGEYRTDMNQNKFALYNKTLNGIKVESTLGDTQYVVLNSQSKSENKKDSLYGNNSQGPFILSASPVIVGSEQVLCNGTLQLRGKDYDIDYLGGRISFLNKLIAPTDKLDIAYEFSQSLYKRTMNAFAFNSGTQDKFGGVLIREADQVDSRLASTNATDHLVAGLNLSKKFADQIKLDSSVAWSRLNEDSLSSVRIVQGGAGHVKLALTTEPFVLDADLTKVANNYRSIGSPDLSQGYSAYNASMKYHDNDSVSMTLDKQFSERRPARNDLIKVGGRYGSDTTNIQYAYTYKQDTVAGQNDLDLSEHSGTMQWMLAGITQTAALRYSRLADTLTSANNYIRKEFGLTQLYNTDRLLITAKSSFSDFMFSDGANRNSQEYLLNAKSHIFNNFSLDGEVSRRQQSQQDPITYAYLNYDTFWGRDFSANGRYSLQYLMEPVGTGKEQLSKQSGSFNFKLGFIPASRLQYTFSPTYALYPARKYLIQEGLDQQARLNLQVLDNMQYALTIKQNRDNQWDKILLQSHPIRFRYQQDVLLQYVTIQLFQSVDLAFRQSRSDTQKTSFDTPASDNTQAAYQGNSLSLTSQAEARWRLSRAWSTSLEYKKDSLEEMNQNPTSSEQTQTTSLKGEVLCEVSPGLNLSLACSAIDEVKQVSGLHSYSYSPAMECRWQVIPGVHVWGAYSLVQSYSGDSQHLEKTILTLDYVMGYVNSSLRLEREYNASPYWDTLQLQGKLGFVF